MTSLAEVRKKVPELDGLDDQSAVDVLHDVYYPDLDRDQVAKALGVAAPPAPPSDKSQFVAGFKRSFADLPGLAAGVGAFGADVVGADDTRDKLLAYAKDANDQEAKDHADDAASISDAWDGKTSLLDFLKNSAGYVTGQALQAVMTGGAGSLGMRMLVKTGAAKVAEEAAAKAIAAGATEDAAKEVAAQAAANRLKQAGIAGAAGAEGAHNFGMELGSIYPDAVDQAKKDGRDGLDGGDLARVGLSAGAAAAVDTAAEGIMASKVLKGTNATGGLARRLVSEVPLSMAREAGTEAVQTGIEHYGAGQPIADDAGMRDIIDSAGVGAVGGILGGGLAATHQHQPTPGDVIRAQAVPEVGPLSRATNIGLEAGAAHADATAAAMTAAAGAQPAPITPTPEQAQVLLDMANQRAAELAQKVKGQKESVETDTQGNEVTLPAVLPQFLTPEEKQEQAFLKEHGGDAQKLAEAYGLPPAASTTPPNSPAEQALAAAAPAPAPAEFTPPVDQARAAIGAKVSGDEGLARMEKLVAQQESAERGQRMAANQADAATRPPSVATPAVMSEPGLPEPSLQPRTFEQGAHPADLLEALDERNQRDAQTRQLYAPILNPKGEPFKTQLAANLAAKKHGGDVVPVDGGFVVQPKQPEAAAPAPAESKPEWETFAPESGTLGAPRADMPQVKGIHRGPLVNFLEARGIAAEPEVVDPKTLKPTQAEFSPQKVADAVERGDDRSILISSDDHVLDGHHQWMGKLASDEPVKAIRLDAPIEQLVDEVKQFPSATTAEGATKETPNAEGPAERAVEAVAPAAEGEPARAGAGDAGGARKEQPAGAGSAPVEADGLKKLAIVEHTTAKGKTLRGVVRTDLSHDEAKAIDPYTFKKDGGWFIREKHLSEAPAEASAAKPVEAPAPAPAAAAAAPEKAAGTLADQLHTAIARGDMPKDNPALRKVVEAFDGKEATPARMKEAQEALETAIVRTARDVVAKKEGDRTTFDVLTRLYESQPNLNVRTSTSIENQAYSTPAPLAFVASRLAGITQKTTTFEPTAGNGMLAIAANPKLTIVNELNGDRAESLTSQGFKPTQRDATEGFLKLDKTMDRVITNPPFGPIKNAAGESIKVKVDGFTLGQIDHLIAARALATMKDDGKAVLIIGANKSETGRSNNDLVFFNWLYSHYNVTSHFEVEGDLYQRQGAGWPVRVITIDGRQASDAHAPAVASISRAKTWSEVYERFQQGLAAERAPAGNGDGAVRGGSRKADDAAAVPRAADGQAGRADRSEPEGGAQRPANVAGGSANPVGDRGAITRERVGERADAVGSNDQAPGPVEDGRPARTPAAAKPARDTGTPGVTNNADPDNQFQTAYRARSSRKDEGVLIPVNMAGPTQDALNRLEDEVGDIDEFARKELGYDSVDALHSALMGLQVDSVASAIQQIKTGKGVIIADQTGIGKGRQAASIIRWAVKNGKTPIFVTVKPSLFTDMFGDLHDIGTDDVSPFILNSAESIKGAGDEKLFANRPALHKGVMDRIVASEKLPEGRNALFMTYSQINVDNTQRKVVMALAPNAVFVLDESHNAGGESNTGEFIKGALDLAHGVTYLSATYAKRPDNMPVYFKTDIGEAVADDATLMTAMESGGLPLQTVVAGNLVKAGQMFRRERSYDGVSIESRADTAHRAEHVKLSDETTQALRAIVQADRVFHELYVKELQNRLEEQGSRVLDMAGNQAKESVDHTQFSSVVHNFVRQMLLGLKAQESADDAIRSLKRDEKPLIAVENTMGSFLAEYAENNNLKLGDALGAFDYRTVLSRALERSRYIVRQLPNGDKVKEYVPLSKLDPTTRQAYDAAQHIIDGLKIDIPVSPIDWMRNELTKAGYTVAEITGRNLAVDYSDPKNPKLSQIDAAEQKDKVRTTRAFNDGRLDALILNVAGSTGISLHASERFKDQRVRHMIVAQAAQDINIFMQMLGRIHRTGQVALPKYTILSADLPAEIRPTALLSAKMKSLNANTSSNTESATSVKAADMLNKYGDQIVAQYLADNPQLSEALGIEAPSSESSEGFDDIARRATGRLALMPVKVQAQFYAEVEEQYHAMMDYLNKTNQNDLEPRTFDFDARETKSATLFEGQNPASPFGEDAVYNEYSVKAQGKMMTPDEIASAMKEHLGDLKSTEHLAALVAPLAKSYEAFRAGLPETQQANADSVRRMTMEFLQSHAIGSKYRVEINGDVYNAVVTNIRSTHKAAGNPFSLSKVQVTLALNGALRSVTVPGTQFGKIEVSRFFGGESIASLFRAGPPNERETAKIVTGNLLGAYGELNGTRGSIITFTKADGSTEQGILLPKAFNFSKDVRQDYRLRSSADAYKFLHASTHENIGKFGINSRDSVVRVTPEARGDGIVIQVPKSKAKGGKYFLDAKLRAITGDFVSMGNYMRATVDDKVDAERAIDLLMQKQALYALPSMADEARSILGDRAADKEATPMFSRSAAPRRADYAWESKKTTDAGPTFYAHDFALVHPTQLDVSDFTENDDRALPMGHASFVDEANTPYHWNIVDRDGNRVGELAGQVDPAGNIVAIHDIVSDKKQAGLGRQVVATIAANTDGDVRIIEAVPAAQPFWDKVGAGYYDPNNNTALDWQGVARGLPQADRSRQGQDAAEHGGAIPTGEVGELSPEEVERLGLKFSRAEEGVAHAPAERSREVEHLANQIASRWANSPSIVVVDSMSDPRIPAAVRAEDTKQRSQGAAGDPEGFYLNGTVYLVANQLPGDRDVLRVLMHESLGHFGLRSVFGKELATILDRMAVLQHGKVLTKAREYGLDMDKLSDRRAAAEEVLAEMAQTQPELGWVQRAVAAIRIWLRDNVPGFSGMKFSDAEIVRNFIEPARGWVKIGGPEGGPNGGMAFARGADGKPIYTHEVVDPKSGKVMGEYQTVQAARAGRDRFDNKYGSYHYRVREKADSSRPMFSRSLGETLAGPDRSWRDAALPAGYVVGDLLNDAGKLSWWHKTVGTPFNLAERSVPFRRVYDSVQTFLNDVSYYASEAADQAPRILPRLSSIKDMGRTALSAEDTKAIAAPIFEGTLSWARDENGKAVPHADLLAKAEGMSTDDKAHALLRQNAIDPKVLRMWQGREQSEYEQMVDSRYESQLLRPGVVWTANELRTKFKLNPEQISLYREFRKSVDASLNHLGISDMLRFGGKDVADVRDRVAAMTNAYDAAVVLRDHLFEQAAAEPERADVLNDTANKMIDKGDRVKDLIDRGYAPLSRFGQYTLDVVKPDGERAYFGLFESPAERSKMARQMAAQYPDAQIRQGTTSQQEYKMFAGVSPETLALFGDMLGLEEQGGDESSKVFQQYIKLAKNSRSAMKRLIERKGIAGFSEDAGRVLAGFVYSNSRQTASNLHMGEIGEATQAIPQGQGQLKDAAIKLVDYVKNPQEEAQGLRGLLFAQYLGGSVASAMVNATQPLAVTLPYLSQYLGVAGSAKQMTAAVRDAVKKTTGDASLDAALKKAEEDGIVSPQEGHSLQAQAAGRAQLKGGDGTKVGDAMAKASNVAAKLQLLWGHVFSIPEQFNRRVTFIAAYRTAVAKGIENPAKFAAKAVAETQFTYNKGNKPQWARGAFGATLFTFKQYTVSYLELLHRMYNSGPEGKRAALLAIAVLFLMSGTDGLPGADDLDDLIDGFMQRLGYNWNTKMEKRRFFASILGDGGAQFLSKGITGLPGAPIDVSGRIGMGNIIPGTGLLTKKADHTSDLVEMAGPAGDLAKRAFGSVNSLAEGDLKGAATGILPTAASNWAKAYDMATTGAYHDQRGYKVLDTDGYDALAKAVGFQPQDVSKVQEASAEAARYKGLQSLRTQEVTAKWANGLATGDQAMVQEAKDERDDWNRKNPGTHMTINMPAVLRRVREMRESKEQRIAETTPKAIRNKVRADLRDNAE